MVVTHLFNDHRITVMNLRVIRTEYPSGDKKEIIFNSVEEVAEFVRKTFHLDWDDQEAKLQLPSPK